MNYEDEMNEARQRQVELVKAQREAFKAGVAHALCFGPRSTADETARRHYPLPKVTRPRVGVGKVAEYKVVGGRLMYRSQGWNTCWMYTEAVVTEDVPVVADLLARPTEEVPGDE